MIEGFPTFEEMKSRTLLSYLSTVVERMGKAADLGEEKVTFYDSDSIEALLKSRVKLEHMGYEVGFDFSDDLDIHEDEVFPSDVKSATIRWERKYDYVN